MSKSTQLFLGLRRENGQIGYLSESLTIPEFFDLIRPSEKNSGSLVDFSPVIEALHAKHDQFADQTIREKYNSVFNYWQESKSYSNLQIKLPKFENLSLLSNELITSLQFRIDKFKDNYTHRRTADPFKNLAVVKAIENDSNIYIDVLLCFIHSKASLEIESFKNDIVLSRYCEYLHDVILDLFNRVVEYSTWNDNFILSNSSLLYHIAFQGDGEINYYTKLLPYFDVSQNLKLHLLSKSYSGQYYNHHNEPTTKIEVEYRNPHGTELEAARILRDLLYKINSISGLVRQLKRGGVDWNPNQDSVEELKQLILMKNSM